LGRTPGRTALLETTTASLDVLQETFLYFPQEIPGIPSHGESEDLSLPGSPNLSACAREKSQRYQATEIELGTIENATAPNHHPSDLSDLQTCAGSTVRGPPRSFASAFHRMVSTSWRSPNRWIFPLGTVKSRLHNGLQTLRKDPRTKEFLGR